MIFLSVRSISALVLVLAKSEVMAQGQLPTDTGPQTKNSAYAGVLSMTLESDSFTGYEYE